MDISKGNLVSRRFRWSQFDFTWTREFDVVKTDALKPFYFLEPTCVSLKTYKACTTRKHSL